MIEMIEPGNTEHRVQVLDHGYVILRNMSGPTRRVEYSSRDAGGGMMEATMRAFDADDTDVANSARMSFDGADAGRSYEIEMKLNRYLLKNQHMTPFEMIQVWLEYKLPIFVARQFHRHRTQGICEISGRYVIQPADWYIPTVVGGAAKDKKQGQTDNLDEATQANFKLRLDEQCQQAYAEYLRQIDSGVAPEHARLFLKANHYTKYLSTVNLRNLLHFLALRDHNHAQVEAQAYAQAVTQLLEPHIPGLIGLYRELMKG